MRFPHTLSLHDARDIHSLHYHFERSREIFLARRRSLLLSLKVSHFPLSHIERYTSVQERSLGFARDDVAEAAFSQHILYTGRGLSIPPYRHFERSREIFLALCSFLLLSQKVSPFPRFLVPFAEAFPFSAITHTALYWCARKIEGFARDDVA